MNAWLNLIHQGDCRQLMAGMPDASVCAIVTDPPYELGFMGKAWDASGVAYDLALWQQALRVLKPGGHLLAFGGSRTYHRMACAIEDAGFQVRDQLMWVYGSGFPKSKNLDGDHAGWGTALKPAHEPICMARKAFPGTVGANMATYGTGALNIDGCRIPAGAEQRPLNTGKGAMPVRHNTDAPRAAGAVAQPHELGRWPANLIHDGSDEVLAAFPDAPGQIADASTSDTQRAGQNVYGTMKRGRGAESSADSENAGSVGFKMKPGARRLDEGSAARFFYCAKASNAERNDGLEHLPRGTGGMVSNTSGQHITRRDAGYVPAPVANTHPTVKPTELMRYLCRLVTPPGGIVLDPFTGSGSTGVAAKLEGFHFIGMELEPEYLEIARARLADAIAQGFQESLLLEPSA